MRNVMYQATRRIYQDVVVSMKSMMHHTKVDNVYLLIEDDRFPYELPACVKTINVSGQELFPEYGANIATRCTYMVLLRAAVMDYIHEDTVLSIDYDTIVKKDIAPLLDIDISGHMFAAVREPDKNWWAVPDYYNFGVLYMNLTKLAEMRDGLVSLLNISHCPNAEQDAMNIVCRGKCLEIPNIYNANEWTGDFDPGEVSIRHYAGPDKSAFYRDEDYQKYLCMSWEEVMG